MPTQTQHGYLLLADISGYTSYLAGVELDHAHEILTELLEIIVTRFEAVLTIVKLEGDAVFAYAPEAKLPRGETLLELLEVTYAAFCDCREASHRRTTCECKACRAIPTLDLKFLAHHGDYMLQRVSHITELLGSDVNLVHRLLKNHVSEVTGWKAYALFTERALEHMGVRPEGLHTQPEAYEHLGEVTTHSLNLKARYQAITDARRLFISAEAADLVVVQDFPAPPPVVWEWLSDPNLRNVWTAGHGAVWSVGARPEGRTGVGARNHCAHGGSEAVETILDWRPFDYYSFETLDRGMVQLETMQLEPLPDGRGTRLHDHIQWKTDLPRWLRRPLLNFMMNGMMKYDQMLANAARMLGEEFARQKAEAAPAAVDAT
ncbi:MAG: DUF2652 domain-containing protein [Anaerolineales bacterium]